MSKPQSPLPARIFLSARVHSTAMGALAGYTPSQRHGINWRLAELMYVPNVAISESVIRTQRTTKKMKPTIYVAGPWIHKDKAKEAKDEFEAAGYTVTSRWIELHPQIDIEAPEAHEYLKEQAMEDVKDVHRADILVLLNLAKSEGKACETGMALAWKKPVILVGPRDNNIFLHLDVPQVTSVKEAIDLLQTWETRKALSLY